MISYITTLEKQLLDCECRLCSEDRSQCNNCSRKMTYSLKKSIRSLSSSRRRECRVLRVLERVCLNVLRQQLMGRIFRQGLTLD